jgi:hypothetical protein
MIIQAVNFEEGKYFLLTKDLSRSKRGVYRVDKVMLNHYPDYPTGNRSSTSCTWIVSRNIEDNSMCEFGVGSVVYSHCSPWYRDYNLDLLGI